MTEATLVLDTNGHLLSATEAARALLGLERSDLGPHWIDRVDVWLPASEAQPWTRVLWSGLMEEDYAILTGPRGRWLTRVVATPLPGAEGVVVGVVVELIIPGGKIPAR